jgi:hypothetical protein
MARNPRPRKAPAKLADRFIGGTLDWLCQVDGQLTRMEKKLDTLLFEAQIQEQIKEMSSQ